MQETWDGLPVAPERPFASCVVVWRRAAEEREFLVLHRAHFGADFAGEWAWTPPSGARQPGESPEAADVRELREETRLELAPAAVESPDPDVALFVAEASGDGDVVLDAEHDAFRWLPLAEAAALCLPRTVAACLETASHATR